MNVAKAVVNGNAAFKEAVNKDAVSDDVVKSYVKKYIASVVAGEKATTDVD